LLPGPHIHSRGVWQGWCFGVSLMRFSELRYRLCCNLCAMIALDCCRCNFVRSHLVSQSALRFYAMRGSFFCPVMTRACHSHSFAAFMTWQKNAAASLPGRRKVGSRGRNSKREVETRQRIRQKPGKHIRWELGKWIRHETGKWIRQETGKRIRWGYSGSCRFRCILDSAILGQFWQLPF
jgi:hypothetical protein